jgi:hypothetical protein
MSTKEALVTMMAPSDHETNLKTKKTPKQLTYHKTFVKTKSTMNENKSFEVFYASFLEGDANIMINLITNLI